jgi:hypothetical protein
MKFTMTRAITILAAVFLVEVIVWAAVGFLMWNWNIATWDAEQRFGFLLMAIMVPTGLLAVVGEFLVGMKSND